MNRVIFFVSALAACGGRQNQADREAHQFECRDRSATYKASKHIAGEEIGVALDCAESGPRIKRWKVDKNGKREISPTPIP